MKVRLHSATSLPLLTGAESLGKAKRWPRAPVCKEMGCEFWQRLSVPGVLQRAPLPPEMQQRVPVSPGMLQRAPLPAGLTGVMLQNWVTAFQRSCEQTGQHMANPSRKHWVQGLQMKQGEGSAAQPPAICHLRRAGEVMPLAKLNHVGSHSSS